MILEREGVGGGFWDIQNRHQIDICFPKQLPIKLFLKNFISLHRLPIDALIGLLFIPYLDHIRVVTVWACLFIIETYLVHQHNIST